MRKGLFFWFSILVAAGVIAGTVFFFGKVPERVVDTAMAIPAIDMDSPRFFFEAESGQLGPELPEKMAEEADESVRSLVSGLSDLLPLVAIAERSSVLGAWVANEPVFYGSFLLQPQHLKDIQEGRIPGPWLESSSGLTLGPSEREGVLRLTAGRGRVVLFLRGDREFLLASHSLEGLDRMAKALEGSQERFKADLTVEPSWPAHLALFDGKLISQAASLRGLKAPDAPIALELAWNSRQDSGEIAWKAEGLKEWLPEKIREKVTPMAWSGPVHFPEPLIAALGVYVPEGLGGMIEKGLSVPDWMEEAGFDRSSLADLIEGPLLASVGGQSRVLLFSLPGILLQLPSRGAEGIRWIEGLWSNKWARFAFSPQPVPGFTSGGRLSIPFTMIAAANEDMVLAGVISDSTLGRPVPVDQVVPVGKEEAVLWFFADLQKAADALESLSRITDLADRFGVDETPDPEDIARLIREMRSMGQVTLVVHDLGSGMGSWKGAEVPAK